MAEKVWVGGTVGNEGNYGTAANWSPAAVPVATDNVHITAASAYPITSGLNQAGVALGSFSVEAGAPAIASAAAYLQISCTSFTFAGSGLSYIDVGASGVNAQINGTATVANGSIGLYLKGSALTSVVCSAGIVGLAMANPGETSTVGIVRSVGKKADVSLGAGCTVTTIYVSSGSVEASCGATTAYVYGGSFTTLFAGAFTTILVYAGTVGLLSSGLVGQVTLNGGKTDTTGSGVPRTFTHLKINPGAKFSYDPAVLTITNRDAPDYPVTISVAIAA